MAEVHNERPVGMVGGVRDAPVGRENDLEAIELARFAVAEHNSKTVRRVPHIFLRFEIGALTCMHNTRAERDAGIREAGEGEAPGRGRDPAPLHRRGEGGRRRRKEAVRGQGVGEGVGELQAAAELRARRRRRGRLRYRIFLQGGTSTRNTIREQHSHGSVEPVHLVLA